MTLVLVTRPPDLLIDPAMGMAAVRGGDGQVTLVEWRRDRLVRESWLRHLGVASAEKVPAPGIGQLRGLACDEQGCVADLGGAKVSLANRVAAAVEDCSRVELTVARVGPETCEAGILIGPRALRASGGLAITHHGEQLEVRTVAASRGGWPWSVNRLGELYIAGQLARKAAAFRRQSGRFDDQLLALRGRVESAEAALGGFLAQSGATRTEGLGADPVEIAGLDGQLIAASVARAGREAVLERLRRVIDSGAEAMAMGEVGGSSMLDNLLALKAELLRREAELAGRYGERHPKIQDLQAEKAKLDWRIREERRGALRQYEGEVARARASERLLAAKLEELKGRALRREADAGRSAALEREIELSRRLYETYLARASAEDRPMPVGAPDARMISEAVPPVTPAYPKPKLILSLTLTGGLLLGLAAQVDLRRHARSGAGDAGFAYARLGEYYSD